MLIVDVADQAVQLNAILGQLGQEVTVYNQNLFSEPGQGYIYNYFNYKN